MIQKIRTSNNYIWLIENLEIKNEAIIGNAVVLSRKLVVSELGSKMYDNYYFSQNIRLIYLNKIVEYLTPTRKELEFFELLRKEKELPFTKKIANQFNIMEYVIDEN
ncbi:hypothetical protein MX629_03020 [Carnobacterium divergens]|uniref:Uncharacterized protein n=1 Tax=Carnobacterium divergens TaxID=2748 RepID=A0AAW8R748_CARDV|nr:hypothetical protein [Carnobacterium divergens]MDT1957391.1 hypothetical protein [Carnobacterium divergens]MDT1973594.1 hypothetical protein [Carnobacterium divergens]